MIRSLIIDDEPRGRKALASLLALHCPDVEVISMADSAQSGIEQIEEHKPELVFLDVQMPQGSGFHMLEQLDAIDFELIFTTAHDQYALKAIKFAALDYLLKPIDGEELAEAVAKAQENILSKQPNAALEGFLKNYKKLNTDSAKLALPFTDGLQFVLLRDIVRFEASGSYTEVVMLEGEKIVVSKPIKVYDEMLQEGQFFRVHNSHLINLNHVVKYMRSDGGRVEMQDKAIIAVSRKKKEDLIKRLSEL